MKFIQKCIFLTLYFNFSLFAQYEMTIQNDLQTANNIYEFDVFVRATSGTINLTSYQLCFGFIDSVSNGGILAFEYIEGSSELNNLPNKSNQIISDPGESGGLNLFAASGSPSTDIISTIGSLVGRFRLTNDVAFDTIQPNISWDFSGVFQTEININNSPATNANNHLINLSNPTLPVEIVSIELKSKGVSVNITWQTKTETNNYGFEVQRKSAVSLNRNNGWQNIGFVNGNGNSNSTKNYTFTDKNLLGGSNFVYRLKQIDFDGTFSYSDEVEVELVPDKYELFQNYPNPFNPTTDIKFSLPHTALVRLDIYNIIGEQVTTLINQEMEAGFYSIPFNGRDLSSGTYIYRIQAENFTQTKKMLLLK